MIVIVEGVDGSGKSTLCKKLVDLGYDQSIITGGPTEYKRYKNLADNYKRSVVIMDRSFITDMVYRSLDLNERRGMDLYEMVNILKTDVKIIHCKSETSYEDSMLRGEDNITSRQRSDIIKNTYDIIISMLKVFTKVEVMNYNWRTNNIGKVIEFIKGGKTNDTVSV